MANLNQHPTIYRARRAAIDTRLLGGIALGAVATFLVLYGGVARPASKQLASLESQIGKLEARVRAVAGQTGSAREATNLLGLLAEQGRRSEAATAALSGLTELQDRLQAEQGTTAAAAESLEALAAMQARLLAQEAELEQARQTLESMVELKARTIAQSAEVESAHEVVNEWDALHRRIAEASGATAEARHVTDQLLAMEVDLLCMADDTPDAQAALNDLIGLKDDVVARTGNLAEAIETFELTTDLQDQFEQVAAAFAGMRQGLAEMMVIESTFQRVLQNLRPLAELGNLRRLDGQQLRQMASQIRDRQQQQIARKSSEILSVDGNVPSASVEAAATDISGE